MRRTCEPTPTPAHPSTPQNPTWRALSALHAAHTTAARSKSKTSSGQLRSVQHKKQTGLSDEGGWQPGHVRNPQRSSNGG